jgi:methionyl-tRNA synthetase
LHTILADICRVVGDANRYFAAEEPWTKKKSDPARMGTILYVTAQVLRVVAILAQPFTPQAAERLLDLLAVGPDHRDFRFAQQADPDEQGRALPEPSPVFPRYVEPAA